MLHSHLSDPLVGEFSVWSVLVLLRVLLPFLQAACRLALSCRAPWGLNTLPSPQHWLHLVTPALATAYLGPASEVLWRGPEMLRGLPEITQPGRASCPGVGVQKRGPSHCPVGFRLPSKTLRGPGGPPHPQPLPVDAGVGILLSGFLSLPPLLSGGWFLLDRFFCLLAPQPSVCRPASACCLPTPPLTLSPQSGWRLAAGVASSISRFCLWPCPIPPRHQPGSCLLLGAARCGEAQSRFL